MAATLAQPTFGLQPPTNDDTMEISSDFGAMDGDIDIDFDSAGEQMQYEEDDQMVDDVKSDRENPDDHVMLDDDITSNPGDREMQEAAPPQEVDEDLLDFSDIEDAPPLEHQPTQPVAQPVVEQPAPAAVNTPSHTPTPAPVSLPEEPLEQVQSDVAAELLNQGADVIDHTVQQGEQDQQPQTTILPEDQLPEQLPLQQEEQLHEHSPHENAEPTVHASEEDAPQHQELAHAVPEDAVPEVTESIESSAESLDQTAQQHPALAAEEFSHEQPAASVENVDTNISASQPAALTVDTESSRVNEVDHDNSRERQPDSPTVTGMHPTVVEYEDSEVYLFPPKLPQGTEQYLLENENLATTSLGDLLQACRSVLGDNLSEDEELVLGFEELDLYISEDSTPAFSTSFSELLEVYLSLHRHDGNMHPPPFRVTLTTKTRFTNRLTLITQAIAEGKGFSQLPFLQHYHLDAEAGFPLEEDFEDDEDDYREDDVHAMEQQHAEQSPEEQHEQSDNNIDNTDNHVSEYATAQDQDHLDAAGQPEEPTLEENGQDETQYYSPEGGNSYEETREEAQPEAQEEVQTEVHGEIQPEAQEEVQEEIQPEAHEEPQEQVEDQHQHGDTSAVVVQDTATGPDGENDDIDFSDDEDDDSSLNTSPASAGGSPHAAQPDELSADQAAFDNELAQATQEVDEVPAPSEDEHFGHEDYQEDAYQNEDGVIEDGQTEFTDVKTNDEAVAATNADVADGNDVTQNESEGHDAQDSVDENVHAMVADGTEQHEQQEQHGQPDNVFDDDFNEDFSGEQNESLPVNGQNGHSSPHEVTGGTVGNDVKAAYDPDTIDFDDDDELENEPASSAQHTLESESAKASPSIKRSYSERNEIQDAGDDEQALKKVRSS